jgi:hypothetical protein
MPIIKILHHLSEVRQDLRYCYKININKFVTFMDMAPMSLKTLFTSSENPVKPRPARLYSLFHDMSFNIPLHAMEKIKPSPTLSP